MNTNQIEKQIELKAPLSRVWRALSDHREFGEWFGVDLDGPFVPGQMTRGKMTIEGHEHHTFEIVIQALEPEHYFSYHWHPYALDPEVDYSQEPPTLVEFRLEATAEGTRLTVRESGFDRIPEHRRSIALRMNDRGWTVQMQDIEQHVLQTA